nr:3-hydroxyacyl-[acyl-carrier-protein] dehydratase FabZ [Burkholderiales bacterium]
AYYFVGIDNARFRAPVMPGDQLMLNVKLLRFMRGIWKFAATAKVGETLVAEAELMCTVRSLK